jgi:hypothetical protein
MQKILNKLPIDLFKDEDDGQKKGRKKSDSSTSSSKHTKNNPFKASFPGPEFDKPLGSNMGMKNPESNINTNPNQQDDIYPYKREPLLTDDKNKIVYSSTSQGVPGVLFQTMPDQNQVDPGGRSVVFHEPLAPNRPYEPTEGPILDERLEKLKQTGPLQPSKFPILLATRQNAMGAKLKFLDTTHDRRMNFFPPPQNVLPITSFEINELFKLNIPALYEDIFLEPASIYEERPVGNVPIAPTTFQWEPKTPIEVPLNPRESTMDSTDYSSRVDKLVKKSKNKF